MEKKINATNHFNKWFKGLRDIVVKRKVLARLDRLKNDNFGDFKRIDNNLFEWLFSLAVAYVFITPYVVSNKLSIYKRCLFSPILDLTFKAVVITSVFNFKISSPISTR